MPGLLLFSSWLTLIVIMAVLVRTFIQRRQELLSIRTFFLLGFIYFYSTAGILYASGFGEAAPSHGQTTLAAGMILFLAAYFVGEWFGRAGRGLAKYVPSTPINPSSPALLVTISVLIVIAFGSLIFARDQFTIFKLLIFEFRVPFAATAVGLATYFLLAKRFNPFAWSVFFMVLAVAAVTTLAATAGRRGVLSVLLAIFWMWYYFRLRFNTRAVIAAKVAIPAAVGMFLLLGYSSVRHQIDTGEATAGTRAQQMLQVITNPRINVDAMVANLNQDTPYNTVFIMEHYPDYFTKDFLEGALYVIVHPIPRALWPDKPQGLGVDIQKQMRAQANLAPGIIGHGWAEAQWIGIIYYGLFFGFLVRVLDEAVRRNLSNPFVIAVLGCYLGNVFALTRGDTPLFFVHLFAGSAAVFFLLFMLRLLFGPVFAGFAPLYPPGLGPTQDESPPPAGASVDLSPESISEHPQSDAADREPPAPRSPAKPIWDW